MTNLGSEVRTFLDAFKVSGRLGCIEDWEAEINRLENALAPIDVPIIDDFIAGIQNESEYQRAHWGEEHDAEKNPADWLWLIAHLTTKAHEAVRNGDMDKARHHTISAAATLFNWHSLLSGGVGQDVSNPHARAAIDAEAGTATEGVPQ